MTTGITISRDRFRLSSHTPFVHVASLTDVVNSLSLARSSIVSYIILAGSIFISGRE